MTEYLVNLLLFSFFQCTVRQARTLAVRWISVRRARAAAPNGRRAP